MAEASSNARVTPAVAECRINALGNDVLLRAISFLEARQLVQTCVLSRRWRNLWRSVPRINATHHEFDGMAESDEERSVLFKKFTNAFLKLRDPVTLDAFRLNYCMPGYQESVDPHAESEDANLWIQHALQSNARSVEVEIWNGDLLLNAAVFASNCFLTSLQLSCVILRRGFFRNLQTGCTALERLLLSGCAIYDIEISSETVKVLSIDDSSYFTTDKRISISISSLSYLVFSASARMPLLKNMGSLVAASVSVDLDGTQVDDILQFLRSLSAVTNLDINFQGTMKMQKNSQWCPKFNNLTALTLGDWCLSADYVLIVFLQNCPNLVKLTVKTEKCNTSQAIISKLKGKEGSLTCQNMEMLEIVCSEGDRNVLEKLLVQGDITSWNVCVRRQ
ncbi:hypothetical protein HU200_042076 [Digitaria exilis]|uniref:F-box domain-containing protein n=1 Tax=Digitaria exilis TaxID=1010633 RepID=A0A835EF61_9POAL|nr:hypothetical protein HU200_042076 [Digitaria exilis]